MNTPDQEQIDHWLSISMESIADTEQALNSGYYQRKGISLQSVYTGTASDYADIARTKLLNGDSLTSVRHEFNTAALCINKSFSMAYEPNDPDYVGDKLPPAKAPRAPWGCVSWSDVSESDAIDGFNFALMAANLDTAKRLANLFQDRNNGKKMFPCINRYAHALQQAILLEKTQGLVLLEPTISTFTAKPPKQGYKINFFNLSLTLSSILSGDEAALNQGLLQILTFYQKTIIPAEDYQGTAYEFICDDAVALANLGLNYNLKVTIEHELLPKRLLTSLPDK